MKRTGKFSRTQIIQYLIDKYHYKSYLEIGVQNGVNFQQIKCDLKVGIDPDETSKATNYMTSDTFFEVNDNKFDIIFIDGLHHDDQCYKDILNSLACLSEDGIIICHDMIPSSYEAQVIPRQTKHWNGDVWRSFIRLRSTREDLEMHVVQTDCGCGIIKRGQQKLIKVPVEPSYEIFIENQAQWLNAISEEEFFELY